MYLTLHNERPRQERGDKEHDRWFNIHSCLISLCLFLVGIDHDGGPPPIGPTTRPDVHPLPSGTHLLFAQSGRIEYVPLEGYDMKKDGAKAVLHLPVSFQLCQGVYVRKQIYTNPTGQITTKLCGRMMYRVRKTFLWQIQIRGLIQKLFILALTFSLIFPENNSWILMKNIRHV